MAIGLIIAGFIFTFKLPDCGAASSYSNVGKYKNVMQHILKDTTKNLEWIFVQTVNISKLCYHPLFETFQKDVLLLEAEAGAIPDVNNSFGLLTFSKLNKNPYQDLALLSAEQQITAEDKLFLFNFDPNPTEKPEDINLPGLGQLPAIIDDEIQGIRSREDVANLTHKQAKLHVQNLKFTTTEKR